MKRTYIDSCVLIAAFEWETEASRRAMRILEDPDRELVVSSYVRLEVLPKPIFHERWEEVDFLESVLDGAAENVVTSPEVTKRAIELASCYDLHPVDALHVSAAVTAGVDELVSMEKPSKPLGRVKETTIVSLHSSASETDD